jgi:hypothetical protein
MLRLALKRVLAADGTRFFKQLSTALDTGLRNDFDVVCTSRQRERDNAGNRARLIDGDGRGADARCRVGGRNKSQAGRGCMLRLAVVRDFQACTVNVKQVAGRHDIVRTGRLVEERKHVPVRLINSPKLNLHMLADIIAESGRDIDARLRVQAFGQRGLIAVV